MTTDRGFSSGNNHDYLETAGVIDYICPRSVKGLAERLEDAMGEGHARKVALLPRDP